MTQMTKADLEAALEAANAKIAELEAAPAPGKPSTGKARLQKRIDDMADKGNPATLLLLTQALQALAASEK
jgi:hypothetical protein